jgi:hypothetical protein
MPKDEQQVHECFGGSKEFKLKYTVGSSTQALWRKNGMPHYRVPNSKKILYKFDEIDAWLAKGKVTAPDIDGA